MKGDGNPKSAGTWDYFGACMPRVVPSWMQTFSVGVFQWVPAAKGTKKGKVVKRFHGSVSNPEAVYQKALEYIQGQVKGEGE